MRCILVGSLLALTGCSSLLEEHECNDAVQPGVVVLIEGLTSAECSTVSVVVRDGSYEERQTASAGCQSLMAPGRPGTYEIIVSAPGFGERRFSGIVVEPRYPKSEECPVEAWPTSVRVMLSPVPSSDAASDDGG